MKKKILIVIITMVIMLTNLTNIYASDGLFNMGVFETAYKLSNEADIDLPFINIFEKSANYDEDVNHSGISFGAATIDVDKKLSGVHLIVATQDMVTIKGEVEHGIIYGTNIVIEGKISGDTILLADNVKILEGAIIEEDIIVVASNLEIAGTVKGSLIASVQKAIIKGTVEKDLRIDVTNLNLEQGNVTGSIHISVPAGSLDNIVGVRERYPNAVIKEIGQETTKKIDGEQIANIIFNGVKVVTIYTVVALILTKKDKNVVSKATRRFIENMPFGILTGTAMLILILVVPILLIFVGVIGLGVVAWPTLIAYLSVVLLSMSISSFVLGVVIYEILKDKLGKLKMPALVGIFAVLYVLSQIASISFYVISVINIMSLSIIMAYIFKRENQDK